MRDAGGGSLAVAAVALPAWTRPSATLVRAAVAGLVAPAPHFANHVARLALPPTLGGRIAQTLLLTGGVILPALLPIGATRRATPAGPAVADAAEPEQITLLRSRGERPGVAARSRRA